MVDINKTAPLGIEIEIIRDHHGIPVPQINKISPEMKEKLKVLDMSESWHLYRKILNQGLTGLFFAALSENDPIKMSKIMGQVAGMNFAINQLGSILNPNNKAKSVDGVPLNHSQAEGKNARKEKE